MPVDNRLQGILTALITPINPDGETADLDGLSRIIDHVIEGGSTGVIPLGGTGEYVQIAQVERERVIHAAVEHTAGRVPVGIGIVAPGLGDAKQTARVAKAAGADYIMPVTPYYVHGSQEGIVEWYRDLASTVDLPIILYNIPARTGVNLEPETVLQLEEQVGTIVGIKECTGNMAQFAELQRLAGEKLNILAGEEYYALSELVHGARGAIMASANLIPHHWTRLYEAARDGRTDEARNVFESIQRLLGAIFAEPNPGPLKAALELAGLPAGPVVKPLMPPAAATMERLQAAMEVLGLMAARR